jgi:hypothetical protein
MIMARKIVWGGRDKRLRDIVAVVGVLAIVMLLVTGTGSTVSLTSSAALANPNLIYPPPLPVISTGSLYYETGPSMYSIGEAHGIYSDPLHTGGLVILDFGAQTSTSTTKTVIADNRELFSIIENLAISYANGYAYETGAPLVLAIGTNNSGGYLNPTNAASFAEAWTQMVNYIANNTPQNVFVAGADDIEAGPEYSGPAAAINWVNAYHIGENQYNLGYYDFGSGYQTSAWSGADLYQVFSGAPNSYANPELYCPGDINDFPSDTSGSNHIQIWGVVSYPSTGFPGAVCSNQDNSLAQSQANSYNSQYGFPKIQYITDMYYFCNGNKTDTFC